MRQQINNICKQGYCALRNIRKIKPSLDTAALKTLIQAFVSSKLDYCNSLLFGLPQSRTRSLQRLQNHAARVITSSPRRDHITPILAELHWLPITMRPIYKICCIVHGCIYGAMPQYLKMLIKQPPSGRNLRSTDSAMLFRVRPKTKYGERSFICCAGSLWNDLPPALRITESKSAFKAALKTLLYQKHFL